MPGAQIPKTFLPYQTHPLSH